MPLNLPLGGDLLNLSTMPSGVPVGQVLSRSLLDALQYHAGVPLMYQPVVEEGTYEDFKACVFRVLSYRICEVALEDMVQECREHGIILDYQNREWRYADKHRCVTIMKLRFKSNGDNPVDMKEFFHYLADKYRFVYNQITLCRPSRRQQVSNDYNDGYMYVQSHMELECEIMWPYWT